MGVKLGFSLLREKRRLRVFGNKLMKICISERGSSRRFVLCVLCVCGVCFVCFDCVVLCVLCVLYV